MQNRILGVLAGRDLNPAEFKLWAENADITIAADSGAEHFFQLGLKPQAIVGDFDSLPEKCDLSGIDLYRDMDQNYSDCDKLIALVQSSGHSSLVVAGVEGDRIDHLLASLSSCLKSPLRVRLALRGAIGDILKPGTYRIPARSGGRISLLPLSPVTGLHAKGVVWPLMDATLEMGGQVSLSNVAEADEVEIQFAAGGLLVVQPRTMEELPDWDIVTL